MKILGTYIFRRDKIMDLIFLGDYIKQRRKDLGRQLFMEVSLALFGPLSLLLS